MLLINGSSIELSCDAPIREPYVAFHTRWTNLRIWEIRSIKSNRKFKECELRMNVLVVMEEAQLEC